MAREKRMRSKENDRAYHKKCINVTLFYDLGEKYWLVLKKKGKMMPIISLISRADNFQGDGSNVAS